MGTERQVKTMKELCAIALEIQDAYNLQHVANTFAEVIADLCVHVNNKEKGFSKTDQFASLTEPSAQTNEHFICKVFVNKMQQLVGRYDLEESYAYCAGMALHDGSDYKAKK